MIVVLVEGEGALFLCLSPHVCLCLCTPVMGSYMVVCGCLSLWTYYYGYNPSLGGCMIVVLVEGEGTLFLCLSPHVCLCLCTPVMESYMVVCGWRREGAVSLYGRTMDLVPVCGVPLYLSV